MISAIIMDAFGVLVESKGNTSRMFYEYVKDKTAAPKEEVMRIYNQYRARSFTEKDYNYEEAIRDTFWELDMKEYYDDFLKLNQVEQKKIEVKNESVIKMLSGLKQKGISVYVLTDFDEPTDYVRNIFSKLGLLELITDIISSKDVGHMKPSPEVFDYTLRKYGLKKEDTAFLGHSHDEVRGAHELGFKTFACFYADEEGDFSFVPDEQRLSGLEELVEKVARED
ncbi:HAD family hydrolase [Candidatus Woesearchaeota archaeon]|nr:HAD family hydrolase [Candidatus Woesearchaeota archaeon]